MLPRVHRRVRPEISIRPEGVSLLLNWSGRGDLNARPPAPKAGALPGCATPRLHSFYTTSEPGCSVRRLHSIRTTSVFGADCIKRRGMLLGLAKPGQPA